MFFHKIVPLHAKRIAIHINAVSFIVMIDSRFCRFTIEWDRFFRDDLNFLLWIVIKIVCPITSYDISIWHYINWFEKLLIGIA